MIAKEGILWLAAVACRGCGEAVDGLPSVTQCDRCGTAICDECAAVTGDDLCPRCDELDDLGAWAT